MSLSSTAPWTAFYGNTPASLDYPEKTMYEMLRDTAETYPDNIACVFQGKETSFRSFLQRIEAAAQGLSAMGIEKGDRVTICMPNTPQALDCFYALNRIGAIPNMIHPLSAAKEITDILLANGIEGIWNMTNVDIVHPESNALVENVHFSDSLLCLSYKIAERQDSKNNI